MGVHVDYQTPHLRRDHGTRNPGILLRRHPSRRPSLFQLKHVPPRYRICHFLKTSAPESLTSETEWLARRNYLLGQWKCPVVIMQGYESRTQPREFYEKAREYIPNAKDVGVRYMQGGHFWTLEDPDSTADAIKYMLEMAEK